VKPAPWAGEREIRTVTLWDWHFAIICGLVWVSALILIISEKLGAKLDTMNHSLTQIEKRLFEIESARGSQDWP
jgi:hypothetical protein